MLFKCNLFDYNSVYDINSGKGGGYRIMRYRKFLVFALCLVIMAGATGCKKSDNATVDTDNSVTSTTEAMETEVVKKPKIHLEDYNLRVLQDADLDFMIIADNADKVAFTEEDIIMPDGTSGEPMIIETDNGDYEVIIFGVVGNAGRYSLTIPGRCFSSTTEGDAEDLIVPFCIDNKNISDKVRLTCTPSSVEVENGGTLTCLLEYTGDIASYNLGDISVTCNGFTADVNVSLSETSNVHMLVLSNIQGEVGAENLNFNICEGTAYDADNKPCNEYIVDINIVDEVQDTDITIY